MVTKIEDSIEEREIVGFIHKEFERRKQERMPFENQWHINEYFMRGRQNVEITADNQVNEIFKNDEKFSMCINHVASVIETRIAKLNSLNPMVTVVPVTSQQSDSTNAKISTQLLKAVYDEVDIEEVKEIATRWSEITGTSFYKTIWDEDFGEKIAIEIDQETGKETPIYEGKPLIIAVSPYEIYPDTQTVEKLSQCRSLMQVKAVPVAEILEVWGKKVHGDNNDVFENTPALYGSIGGGASPMSTAKLKDSAIVYEYWEKPSRKYEKGRHIVVAGNKVIELGEMTDCLGKYGTLEFPFVKQVSTPCAGQFWGISAIDSILPMQRAINMIKTAIVEALRTNVVGIPMFEAGSVNADEYKDSVENGVPLEFNGTAPSFLKTANFPPEYFVEAQNLLNDITNVSGTSELQRSGQAPKGLESGFALSILDEKNNTRISTTAKNSKRAMKQIALMTLRLMKQHAKIARVTRISDESGVSVITWKDTNLNSEDIKFVTEDEINTSPARQRQIIGNLITSGQLQEGLIPKPILAAFVEKLGIGGLEFVLDDGLTKHRQRALKENVEICNGNNFELLPVDDDIIHIQVHTSYAIDSEFQYVPDVFRELLFKHIASHEEQLNKKTGQAQVAERLQQTEEQLQAVQKDYNKNLDYINQLETALQNTEVLNNG
jgi:hypothetical protein